MALILSQTLLELAGVKSAQKQTIDGMSLVPLLKGGSLPPRPLFWHYPHYGNQGGEPSSIIRSGDWKLIHYWEDGHNEFYNLADDVGEQHDLSVERTAKLWNELQAWLKETGAKIPEPNPDYNPAWAAQQQQTVLAQKNRLENQHADYLKPDWQPDPTWWKSLTTND